MTRFFFNSPLIHGYLGYYRPIRARGLIRISRTLHPQVGTMHPTHEGLLVQSFVGGGMEDACGDRPPAFNQDCVNLEQVWKRTTHL